MVNEKKIQNDILDFLKTIGLLVFPIQNAGVYDQIKKIYRRPPKHFRPGISDIIGMLPSGKLLAIEVKAPKGKPTPDQLKFLVDVQGSLGVAFISRSVWQTYSQLLPFWPEIKHYESIALRYKKMDEMKENSWEPKKSLPKNEQN